MDFDPSDFESFKATTSGFDAKDFDAFKKAKPDEKPKWSWSDAVTDIPAEIGRTAMENVEAIKKGLIPSGQGERGSVERLLDTGKGVMAIPALALSPITGTARSLVGHTLANAEHRVGEVIAPDIAVKDDPKKLYDVARSDVDTALAGVGARGLPVRSAPVAATGPRQEIAAASDRLTASGSPVDVPQAIASDSMIAQRSGQALRNMPVIGDAIPKATARLTGQLEEAAGNVASEFGGGGGPNVAHNIGQTIGGAAEREASAAKSAAMQGDAAVLADWERAVHGANETVANTEGAALARARQSVGSMSPQDMGETLIARLRQGEQEARATKERLYGVAGEGDAAVTSEAVGNVRSRVAQSLENDGRVVDGVLTPASSRMMDELQRFSTLNIENRAVGARSPIPAGEQPTRAAVSVQGIEQTRKRLNATAQAATNDADRAAARRIIREFDAWESDAFDNALFSGSDAALNSYREARAANASWRNRFHNDRDDADRVINRIVTGEVTPQEVSNYVLGATKVGSKGVSSRLLTRLAEATGNDPEVMTAVRGGVWNRLTEATEGTAPKAGARVADSINEFLNGSGRDVANRLFSEPQRSIMRSYSQALRQGEEARDLIHDVAANTRPSASEVGIGPFQRLANDVLGKGGRADEALYSAINSYAKSGSRGDITLLSRVLQAIPQSERGNLAGAMVRDMGVSPRTGQFSPDVFVSTWNTYTPQAKSLLFGMSGPQRTALDDIAKISMRMKDVGSKFGNPSGTAQNVNFFGLASAFFAAPITTIASGLGGAVAAKLLSSPVGAVSASKWSRAYERMANLPSAANIENFKRASSMLAINVNRESGIPIREVLQQLQGPVPAGAGKKDNRPEGVGNY